MTEFVRKEEAFLQKRAIEIQKNAFYRKKPQFLDFLDLNEQNMVAHISKEPDVDVVFYGGFSTAERKMAGFFPVEWMEQQRETVFPINLIHVYPKNPKFAQRLSHRDFLGAVMNLGMERSQVGDIIVKESEQTAEAYIYVTNLTSHLMLNELNKVRNTNVVCESVDCTQASDRMTQNMEEVTVSIRSERLDGIIGHVFHLPRSQTSELFRAEKVYRNSKVLKSPDKTVSAGDVISVRGYGKFRYDGECYQNKKGNLVVKISKYV